MRAIPQLVSAPLNPIQLQNILGRATHHVSTVTDNTYKIVINVFIQISAQPRISAHLK